MSMMSTIGVANIEMMPHQPSASVTKKYWVKYLLTQLRHSRPPIRRWKNITTAPMCRTNSTFRVGASIPHDWQIMKCPLIRDVEHASAARHRPPQYMEVA